MKGLIGILILSMCGFKSVCAPFQNLNFEQAKTNYLQGFDYALGRGYLGTTEDLLPGWQVYDNTNLLTTIGYNFVADFGQWVGGPVPGTLPVYYFVGFNLSDHNYSIIQRGDIPPNAIRLTYSVGSPALDATINGIPLQGALYPGQPLGQASLDVSPFAGQQNVELKFTSSTDPAIIQFFGSATLDDIAFFSPPPFVESDFNGDDVPDVVFEHPEGFVGVWFMNKGPDLISASYFNPEAVADPRWHIVGTGNFAETNKTDLLFQHEDGSLAVWSMDGTNLVSAALLSPSQPGEGWKVVGTGDMNHDGKKDILFQHTDGTLAVWFMDGINLVYGVLLNPDQPGDSGWRVVGTADLARVGNTDLIFQHSDGTLAGWYMDGTNLVQGVLLNPAAPGQAGWRVAGTLDLNQDGKTDLLFQHDDGTVAVWLMDGINLISGQFLNPANPGAGWRIAGPK